MNILPLQLATRRRRLSSVDQYLRVTRRSTRAMVMLDLAIALASPFATRALFPGLSQRAVLLNAVALAVVTIVAFGLTGEYARHPRPRDGALRRAGRILLITSFFEWIAALVVMRFEGQFPLATMYATWLVLATACIVARSLVGRMSLRERERALVIGSGRVANRIATLVSRHPGRRIEVAGYLDDEPAPTAPAPGRLLGGVDDLPYVIVDEDIDLVVIAFSERSDESLLRTLRECDLSGVDVVVVPRLFEVLPPFPRTYDLGGLALLDASERTSGFAQSATKRALDFTGALVALTLLAPALAVIALAIRSDDGGPVIFRQRRVGKHGRTFTILKFRTLSHSPQEFDPSAVASLKMDETIELVKRAGAARPTRVGAFLRRTSADELPQLWNVLRGDMSMVGPRPLRVFEVDALDDWQRSRHNMRPGMTGLWQVMGRSDVRWDERLQLDCAYVRNWSLVSDIGILARTLPAVFLGRGAL